MEEESNGELAFVDRLRKVYITINYTFFEESLSH